MWQAPIPAKTFGIVVCHHVCLALWLSNLDLGFGIGSCAILGLMTICHTMLTVKHYVYKVETDVESFAPIRALPSIDQIVFKQPSCPTNIAFRQY